MHMGRKVQSGAEINRKEARNATSSQGNPCSQAAKQPRQPMQPSSQGNPCKSARADHAFVSQVDSRQISDEEKLSYLLEMVNTKVRDRISNLNPSSVGYKTAWERLKAEYGQTKVVVAAHMDDIINLPTIKPRQGGNFDALQTLGHVRVKC